MAPTILFSGDFQLFKVKKNKGRKAVYMKRKTLSTFPGEQNPGGVLTVMKDVTQSHKAYQNNFCIPSISKQNLHIHVSHIILCMNNRVKSD